MLLSASEQFQVMQRVCAILEAGEDSNSGVTFEFDVTGKVYRGRTDFGDDDKPPFLAVVEPPVPLDQLDSPPTSGDSYGPFDVAIQGFAPNDRNNPLDPAYRFSKETVYKLAQQKALIEKVRRATGKNPPLLGLDFLTDMQIGRPVHRPADETSATAYFYLQVRFQMADTLA